MEKIKKYKVHLIATVSLILLLLLYNYHSNRYHQLQGKYSVLQETYKVAKDGLITVQESRRKIKDSIKFEDAKKEAQIKYLSEVAQKSKDRIKELEANNIDKKKQIKSLTLVGVAKELNTTYGGSNATAKEKSIDISGSLPYQILETVADANSCQEIVGELNIQLSKNDSIVSIKDSQIKDSRLNLFSAEKEIEQHKVLEESADKNIKNLEKQNKKLKIGNFILKYIVPPATFFMGYKLAK